MSNYPPAQAVPWRAGGSNSGTIERNFERASSARAIAHYCPSARIDLRQGQEFIESCSHAPADYDLILEPSMVDWRPSGRQRRSK